MHIPRDMFKDTLEIFQGRYDVPVNFHVPPVVLDIGANIGAFSIWASQRWPDCLVHAYEPIPLNASMLEENVTDHRVNARVVAAAVTPGSANLMYLGKHNRGEASLHDLGEQILSNTVKVAIVHPNKLPPADVIKIDTEGCEVPILNGLVHLAKATAVMFEWHSRTDREKLDSMLHARGFTFFSCHGSHPARGVSKYLRLSQP